jgi:hypothetical protein
MSDPVANPVTVHVPDPMSGHVPDQSHILSVKKCTEHEFELIIDVTAIGEKTFKLPLCESRDRSPGVTSGRPYVLFHLSFTVYERGRVQRADKMDDVWGIVLDYAVENNDIKLNSIRHHRQKEIETLKKEREALCDLIDGTLIEDHEICSKVAKEYQRFYEMKTIDEMRREFDLINEQIRFNASETRKIQEQPVYNNVSVKIDKSMEKPYDSTESIVLNDGTTYECGCMDAWESAGNPKKCIRLTFSKYQSQSIDISTQ